MTRLVVWLAPVLLLAAAVAQGSAVELPLIPEQVEPKSYQDVPEPWRDYLLKAREAERIADPLQRCLAFPDLPGNKWPQGHAEAHCRDHFAIKRPTLDEIAGLVERGEMAVLDRMFDQALARHYSKDAFSDDIHDTFNYLLRDTSKTERIGQITEAWLRQAPESAYANLARGAYFNGAAWRARGTGYAADTPKENMRRKSELVDQAIPYFRKALAINPRLMPAYSGLVDMGNMDSRDALLTEVIGRAKAVDPACPELANRIMHSLTPRWGGSYEDMLAFANELSRHVAARPQLAIYLARPYGDRGDRLIVAEDYGKETQELLAIAVSMGSDEETLRTAAHSVSKSAGDAHDRFRMMAYLLQEARFREPSAWGMRSLAENLANGEPEWSLYYSLRALEIEPEHEYTRLLVAIGSRGAKRFSEAQKYYDLAIASPAFRQHALGDVALMWLSSVEDRTDWGARTKAANRAKPYIDRLVKEYPQDGRGWILLASQRIEIDRRIDGANVAVIREAVLKADRKDPWQEHWVKNYEGVLEMMAKPGEQTPKQGK